MKTKEELNALKEEVENLNKKLAELTEEELKQVVGGTEVQFNQEQRCGDKEYHLYENTVEKDFKPNF